MEQMFKKAFCLAALLSGSAVLADNAGGPFLLTRSESARAGRLNAGLSHIINQCDRDELYGVFSVTGGFGQSFRSERIANCFFGDSLTGSGKKCATLNFSGSDTANRGDKDWLSDYFIVGSEHEGNVTFNPRIRRGFADLDLYLGLDEWMCGMWFRVHSAISHVSTDLRVCNETVTNVNTADAAANTAFIGAVSAADANKTVLDYFQGKTNTASEAKALAYSKWSSCKLDETKLADIHFDLGWNFFCCEDYHAGLSLHVVAPTGNRPTGEYLFEPIVGNGKHFELGGGFTGHSTLWRCEEDNSEFGFYLDAYVTHLFRARQGRTFDLVGKPHSRYALATKVEATVGTEIVPVANLTHQNVDVSIGVQADLAARFVYSTECYELELGYNLWATSCEKFKDNCDCTPTDLTQYVLKGGENPTAVVVGQSDSTIFAFGTDNAAVATLDSIGVDRQGNKGLSHTVYSHLNYTWEAEGDCAWGYILGLGGEAEFGARDKDCKTANSSTSSSSCDTDCKSCRKCSASQWGVWVKGGITF